MSEVYKNPEGVFDRLVALTEEGVFIANPEPTQLDQWERALTDGSVLPAGAAQILPYGCIESVKANRHRDDINIHYRDGSRTVARVRRTSASRAQPFVIGLCRLCIAGWGGRSGDRRSSTASCARPRGHS